MSQRVPVSYLDLAKEAKSRGDMRGVWLAFKQHARVMRKKKGLPRDGKPILNQTI